MKNILSSLNESEKKRILEMHYSASKRHYLTEGVKDIIITSNELSSLGAVSVEVLVDESVGPDVVTFKMKNEKLNLGKDQGVASPSVYCRRNSAAGAERGSVKQTNPYPSLDVNLLKSLGLKQCEYSQAEFNKIKGIVNKNPESVEKAKTTSASPNETLAQKYKMTKKDQIILTRDELDSIGAYSATFLYGPNEELNGITFKMKNPKVINGAEYSPTYGIKNYGDIRTGMVNQSEPYEKENPGVATKIRALGKKQADASNSFK
jgi:hypothetical protein